MTGAPMNERLGFEALCDRASRRSIARFSCASCQAHHDVSQNKPLPPELLLRKMADAGWTRRGQQKWICGGCATRKKSNGESPMTSLSFPKPPPISLVATSSGPANELEKRRGREPVIKEIVEISAALEMYFDKATGKFSDGQSDDTIAKQLNMPVEWVRNIRREGFAELARDPEYDALASDLKTLRNEASGFRAAIATMEGKINGAFERLKKMEARR